MVRLGPAFLAAPPDLTLTGEEGHPPGPGRLIGLPAKGGLEGLPRWKIAGLVSPNFCLSDRPWTPLLPQSLAGLQGYSPCGWS